MDWRTLLVHYGQTIVIGTGCFIGFIAVVIFRIDTREIRGKKNDRTQ
jgi:hypothetical protein